MVAQSQSQPRVVLRLSDELKAFLEERARRNFRSLNGELNSLVRSAMEADKAASGEVAA